MLEALKSMHAQPVQHQPVQREDEFESALLAELVELRKTERALQKMYPRLKSKPQLRTPFLQKLAEMQQRAYRLDVVLNPLGAIEFAEQGPAPVHSSVA